ncbi:MAG TPA: hypothetical protein VGH99_21225 [Pseudonocardia sp.]|jgi:hypothetical protein
MDVTFSRTGERRYSVTVDLGPRAPRPRMEPAPGCHEHLQHDLVHLMVERHWRLREGIYGQLAGGGDASTFRPVDQLRTRRTARAMARRNTPGADVGRSERLAAVAFAAWQARHGPRGKPLPAATAPDRLAAAGATERELAAAVDRLDELAPRWHALGVGGALTLPWPVAPGRRPGRGRQRRVSSSSWTAGPAGG